MALFFAPPVLLLSLITYKMPDEVFRSWLRFAYWWIPLSIALTLLSGLSSGGSWGIPNIFDQEFFAFVFSALFFLVSLVIIAAQSKKSGK